MNPFPSVNPYAPPQAPVTAAGHGFGPGSARIDGQTLVVANEATFPPVCLKCGGVSAIEWRDQKFSYVPPWARLLGALFQVLLAKRSRFRLPLCPPCHKQWKKWNLFAWLVWMPGVVVTLIGVAALDADAGDVGLAILLVGLVLAFAGFIGVIAALVIRGKRVVYATKIDKTHSWLRGVHAAAMQAVAGGR